MAGKIPYDKEAVKAVNNGQTIIDIDCAAGDATKIVFKNVITGGFEFR